MSFIEACSWSLVRAVVAALLAIPAARCLTPLLTASGRWKLPLALLAVSPLLVPELLVGYGWSSFQLTQLHRPEINHWLYFGLIVFKFLPAGALARVCSPPPPVSELAIHCDRLLGPGRDLRRSRGIWLRGRIMRDLPVAGVVFLLVFQEFEIASLMQVPAWTVHLFDSQTVGLQAAETFRRMLIPIAIELLVLMPLITFCLRTGQSSTPRWRETEPTRPRTRRAGLTLTATGCLLLWVIPFGLIAGSSFNGMLAFAQNRLLVQSFAGDLLAAIVLGTGAAVLALSFSRLLMHGLAPVPSQEPPSRGWRLVVSTVFWLLMIPGLAGPLVVCLSVLLGIQWAPLQPLRPTVLPAVFAMTLFVLPRAMLFQLLIGLGQPSESGYLARLLTGASDAGRSTSGARLQWATELKWLFAIGCLVFYQAMMNLTAAAFLCPPTVSFLPGSTSVVPLPVRLYNLMHFGRNGPLSIMALLSVLIPGVLMIALAWLLPAIYVRLKRRPARV